MRALSSARNNTVRHRYSYVAATATIVAAAAGIELYIGRVPWCTCGYLKLWHGVVQSAENSQHLTDWYTPSHVIHGIGLYAFLWLVARRVQPGARFVAAVFIEAAWEVLENSSIIIDRYRAATIALDYYGDSVVNSAADIAAMMLGFWLVRQVPVWVSISLVIVMEVVVALTIRDNLTLNILMLVYPIDAVKRWQLGV
jgi:Protein of unknown function (DUF2585)